MYKKNTIPKTSLKINNSFEGETIENKIVRIINNKEPIKDATPQIYTERKDGVRPEFDIRTDKFEQAIDDSMKIAATHLGAREERIGEKTWDTMSDDQRKSFQDKFPNNKLSIQAKASETGGQSAQGTIK